MALVVVSGSTSHEFVHWPGHFKDHHKKICHEFQFDTEVKANQTLKTKVQVISTISSHFFSGTPQVGPQV